MNFTEHSYELFTHYEELSDGCGGAVSGGKFTIRNNSKRFPVKYVINEIDRIYTLVGGCRESDWDVEVEELDYKEI